MIASHAEYLQAVLDWYDDTLARLDKKYMRSNSSREDSDIYNFYHGRRQEVYQLLNKTFFDDFGGIPEEFKRNGLGERIHKRK